MTARDIARVAHEANRAYCRALGDESQVAWEDTPEWLRQSCVSAVELLLRNPDMGASALHEAWMEARQKEGWAFGPTKDAEGKRHPALVDWQSLDASVRAKDYLFLAVVDALRGTVEAQP